MTTEIVEISVHYRDKDGLTTEVQTVPPVSQDVRAIKVQVGRMIKALPITEGYYYVVIGAMKSTGKVGYRTIIPKTLVNQ